LAGKSAAKGRAENAEPGKPIGRRERRSTETRRKIFHSALRLFAERGFSATTIDAIAAAADIGKGTFFNYFANKESILLEFQEMQMEKVRAFVAENMNSYAPLAGLIYQLAATMTQELQLSPALFKSLMTAIFSNEAVGKRMAEGLELSRERLGALIGTRQQTGEIRSDIKAEEIAHSLQRMILGSTLVWSLAPVTRFEDDLRRTIEVFVHGIQSR